jgi:CheY-like chemotaxis protein
MVVISLYRMARPPIQEKPPRVLLVEDDPDTRELLQVAMVDDGCQVYPAANGAEALTILANLSPERRPTVILLDLMMPVLNGWDFRARQRANPAIADIPVVLMSAGAHIAAATGDLDAAGSLAKPVEIPDLLDKVRKLGR